MGMPVMGWTLLLMGVYAYMPSGFQFLMLYLLFASISVYDFYGFMYRSLADYMEPYLGLKMTRWHKVKMSIALFFYTPVHLVVQTLPRLYAPIKYYRSPDAPQLWHKTERTLEVSELPEEAPVLA
jgi:hypothetical protein